MYKCLPVDFGVDVSLNEFSFFKFGSRSHKITNLGGNKVRVTRNIDNTHEIYEATVSEFVDVNTTPVATDYEGLVKYFSDASILFQSGEGISADGNKISIVAGGPSTLGGYKVGTGLMVDGEGKLSATASSEVTKILATEAEMLALSAEPLRPYRVIRLDSKKLYYLNAGTSPSVLANWFVGPSIETAVISFNGRTGAVEASVGDYTLDTVHTADKTTSTQYKFVIDNTNLYIEDVATQERKEIASQSSLSDFDSRFSTLNDLVTNQVDGVVKRLTNIEERPAGKDYSSEIDSLKVRDDQLNTLILSVDGKVDSTTANTVVLDQRISTLENKPAGKDYSPEITSLTEKNSAQDIRLGAIDSQLIGKAPIVNGKVPYENLPEFPVGRKVNVANRAARLALSPYTDLTIAYESDTGDAYGLDANADPAITANWSKLGNAQAIGVSSFNGRTGAIGPQNGDYITNQISETLTKQFVTPEQKSLWDAKPTVEQVDGKIAAQTTRIDALDSSKLDKAEKGALNGVATLANGKVPISQLPTSAGGTTTTAGTLPVFDANGKLGNALVYRDSASGLCPLDASRKVPIVNLPSFLPQKARTWVDVKSSRTYNAWFTNNSGNDMEVFIRTNAISDNAKYLLVNMRANDTSSTLAFAGTFDNATGNRYLSFQTTVPKGWQYAVQIAAGTTASTINNIAVWRELS